MILHEIKVDFTDHCYPIYIGKNILNDSEILQHHLDGQQVMIVTNQTIAEFYLKPLTEGLKHYAYDFTILPDGEQYKTISHWQKILDNLIEKGYHRDASIITLGGGVVGDTGGFAAACYQRGINFIQIPTSLLAQVDASIGGKTAINHPSGKNLIGAFHQPHAVIIDLNTLKTLPQREFCAGLAEIVKAALIEDAGFFAWLEKNAGLLLEKNEDAISHAIRRACEIKRDIVVTDEKEKGIRAFLNLGHTFAHAIEHVLNYQDWLHGEAVAMGLLMSSRLALHRKKVSAADNQRIAELVQRLQLPTQLPSTVQLPQIIHSMRLDKKVMKNKMRFIILNAIGSVGIVDDVSEEELKDIMSEFSPSPNRA